MDRILEIIADIRARLGTCQQRDADAAVLLGILDSCMAQNENLKAQNAAMYETCVECLLQD